MNNNLFNVIILISVIITLVIIFNKDKSKNKFVDNKDFKIKFNKNSLKCNCDLEHFTSNKFDLDCNDDKSVEIKQNIQKKKSNKQEYLRDYSNHMLNKCYYDLCNKSAERYYTSRYRYPLEPKFYKNKDLIKFNNKILGKNYISKNIYIPN